MSKMCIKAYHDMEERYSRLVMEYFTLEQKEEIFNTVNEMMKKFDIFPNQTMLPSGDFQGQFCLELHDDYNKEGGDLYEAILKKLNIDHCEIG
jgi:hypothetical protein